MAVHLVLLAGGRGTRFWPLSRRSRPKQLLPLLSDRSLLRETWERVAPLGRRERSWVITASDLVKECRRELPELAASRILGEPVGRNTAPALALAAALARKEDPRAVLSVFPSDHHIGDLRGFRALVRRALRCAREERALVTLGVRPTEPETGYGYIETSQPVQGDGAVPVKAFVEKPDLARARRYLKSGRHLWNSGMFFLSVDTLAEAFAEFAPEIWEPVQELAGLHGGRRFAAAFERIYPELPSVSFDHAVMERARGVKVMPAEVGWSDVGNWTALETLLDESEGNHVSGQVLAIDAKNNIVMDEEGLTALLGVENLVIVRSGGALLVCHRDSVQSIRGLVARLEDETDGCHL
jgi:mannose-1-phosphate guanylyltransferase